MRYLSPCFRVQCTALTLNLTEMLILKEIELLLTLRSDNDVRFCIHAVDLMDLNYRNVLRIMQCFSCFSEIC